MSVPKARRAGGKSELGSRPPPLPSQFRQFGSRVRSRSKFANRHSFALGAALPPAHGGGHLRNWKSSQRVRWVLLSHRRHCPTSSQTPAPGAPGLCARSRVAASCSPGPGAASPETPGISAVYSAAQPGHLRSSHCVLTFSSSGQLQATEAGGTDAVRSQQRDPGPVVPLRQPCQTRASP